MHRTSVLLSILLVLGAWPAQGQSVAAPVPFATWLEELLTEAGERGFGAELIDQTLAHLEPLHRVITEDRSQAELNPGFGRYLAGRLTKTRIQRGLEMAKTQAQVLGQVEDAFDVQRRFVLAIWGIETAYGRITGRTPVFQALATLAWEPRRSAFFRGELFDALAMVQRGDIEASVMTGSWAGAMGHPQFMPSSYLKYAVDFDKDGRRDIWRSTPDALASIASYLKGFGWNGDETWGREVKLTAAQRTTIAEAVPKRPQGCYAVRNMTERRPLAEWSTLGLRRTDGGPLPAADVQAGLVDVGERAFLVYPNYDAILGYNCAHYYALSVALLADRLAQPPQSPAKASRAKPAPKKKASRRR